MGSVNLKARVSCCWRTHVTSMRGFSQVDLKQTNEVFSAANVTDIHEDLYFAALPDDNAAARQAALHQRGFGIWSIQWSSDAREVIAGTNNAQQAICVYDVNRAQVRLHVVVMISHSIRFIRVAHAQTIVRAQGHDDDVNSVAFAEQDNSNVFFSGSDDLLCKVSIIVGSLDCFCCEIHRVQKDTSGMRISVKTGLGSPSIGQWTCETGWGVCWAHRGGDAH